MLKKYFVLFLIIFSSIGFSAPPQTDNKIKSAKEESLVDISKEIDKLDNQTKAEFSQIEYKGTFIKMIFSLIAIIVLGGFTIYYLKKMNRSRLYSANLNYQIKILEKRVLSPKSILYLIEYEGQKMIVSESQLDMKIKNIQNNIYSQES